MKLLSLDSLPPNLRDGTLIRQLVAGQRLFQQGDSAKYFFMVQTGRFKLIRYFDTSNVINLEFTKAGDSLGDRSIFADVYDSSAIALVDSTVVVYPKQVLLSSLREYPDLAIDFIAILSKKIQSLQVNLELRNIRLAHQRLLQYLRYLATADNEKIINLDRPYKEIALELGFTPETLSRALLRLEQAGKIDRQPNQIILHNASAA